MTWRCSATNGQRGTYQRTVRRWMAGELDETMPGGPSGAEVLARFDAVVADVLAELRRDRRRGRLRCARRARCGAAVLGDVPGVRTCGRRGCARPRVHPAQHRDDRPAGRPPTVAGTWSVGPAGRSAARRWTMAPRTGRPASRSPMRRADALPGVSRVAPSTAAARRLGQSRAILFARAAAIGRRAFRTGSRTCPAWDDGSSPNPPSWCRSAPGSSPRMPFWDRPDC